MPVIPAPEPIRRTAESIVLTEKSYLQSPPGFAGSFREIAGMVCAVRRIGFRRNGG
jgi:hypothetical protein